MKKQTHKWINGTRGALSLMLALLLLPFFSLAAVLVEAGRYQSAVKTLDEVLGSSAISTLANYDGYLLDRFGLLSLSQDNEPTDTLNTYFSGTELIDLKSISMDGSPTVAGQYPLSNLSTLRRQVLETSKYTVPAKVAVDFLNLEDLIKDLEKATKLIPFLNTISAGSEAVSAEAEMLEALEGTKKSAEKAQNAISEYNNQFSVWQNSVTSLINHLKSERPGGEDEAKEWDKQADDLRDVAESARKDYEDAIEDLKKALDDLQQKVEDEVKGKIDFANSMLKFEATGGSGYLELEYGDDKDMKTLVSNEKSMINAIRSSGTEITANATDCINSFEPEKMASAIRALQSDLSAVSGYHTDSVTKDSITPDAAQYRTAQVDGLADADGLKELLDAEASEMNDNGLLEFLDAMLAVFDSLVHIKGLFDPELSSRLDLDYYQANYGGLPSTRENRPDKSAIELIVEDLGNMVDAGADLSDAIGEVLTGDVMKLLDLLLAIKDLLEAVINLIVHTVQLLVEIAGRVIELVTNPAKTYERVLVCGYMVYNLPNRTNYKSEKAATGYSYNAISYGDVPVTTGLPLASLIEGLKALAGDSGTVNKNFSGAELEYILWGTSSEIGNQTMQFMALYLLRLLLNLPTVLTNQEVQSYAAVAGPCAPVIWIIFCFAEPLADTMVLVNGGEIPVIKSDPYLTVGGIPDLIQEFTNIKFNDENIEKIEGKVSEISGFSIYQTNKDRHEADTSYAENLMKLDYTQYSLLMMLVFASEDTCLLRLSDLIQTESTAYRLDPAHVSLSDRVLGTQKDFSIDESYTSLKVTASGSLVQLLPVPALSAASVFRVEREIYRGY